MSKTIEVRWEIDDGYVGGSRPQYTEIYLDDICGETDREIEDEVYEIVDEEFRSRISASIMNLDEVVEAIKKAKSGGKNEDTE